MSSFKKVQPGLIGGQAIDAVSASAKHPLGQIVQAKDLASTEYGQGEFIYLVGVASTVVGSVVTYDAGGFTTALAAANAVGGIAVAMSANVASRYGWYQISGRGVVKGLASLAADKLCYLTATAGSIDDAVVAGDAIHFMETTSALNTPSSGLAEVTLSRPFVTNESN
jgi:hypothetical protein|tara:strand:+ start:6206 stop:6709 length:504 start_codon:yes stop_codon:yes gene_type:complete